MPLQYVATTYTNRLEKKDQVLKIIVYCMAKLSIKQLFRLVAKLLWLALEWHIHYVLGNT